MRPRRARAGAPGAPETRREAAAGSPEELEALALRYLNRFDCTAKKLHDYLRRRSRPELEPRIDELIERYQRSGLLDDGRFAAGAVQRLSQRGASSRAIAFRLGLKGVPAVVVNEVLEARAREVAEPDLEAAKNLVRRRKLGPYRPEAERETHRRRDLAALARAGFDFETARRALGWPGREDDDF